MTDAKKVALAHLLEAHLEAIECETGAPLADVSRLPTVALRNLYTKPSMPVLVALLAEEARVPRVYARCLATFEQLIRTTRRRIGETQRELHAYSLASIGEYALALAFMPVQGHEALWQRYDSDTTIFTLAHAAFLASLYPTPFWLVKYRPAQPGRPPLTGRCRLFMAIKLRAPVAIAWARGIKLHPTANMIKFEMRGAIVTHIDERLLFDACVYALIHEAFDFVAALRANPELVSFFAANLDFSIRYDDDHVPAREALCPKTEGECYTSHSSDASILHLESVLAAAPTPSMRALSLVKYLDRIEQVSLASVSKYVRDADTRRVVYARYAGTQPDFLEALLDECTDEQLVPFSPHQWTKKCTDAQFERLYAFKCVRTQHLKMPVEQVSIARLRVMLRYVPPVAILGFIVQTVYKYGVPAYDLAIDTGLSSKLYLDFSLDKGYASPTVVRERELVLPEHAWSASSLREIMMERRMRLGPSRLRTIVGGAGITDELLSYAMQWVDGRTKEDVCAFFVYYGKRLVPYLTALLDAPGERLSALELFREATKRGCDWAAQFIGERYLADVFIEADASHAKRPRQ